MSFSPKTWVDGSGGGTPITAAELNRIEAGIAEAEALAAAAGGGGGAVASVNGHTGTVVLNADDIADGASNKAYTAAEKTKLGAISGSNTGDQDLSALAPKASPALTGTPTAPTATAGTNTTQLATTAFVTAAEAVTFSSAQTYADGKVVDSIADADTTHAPSRNSVFDALALKQPLGLGTFPTNVRNLTANATLAVNDLARCNATGGIITLTIPNGTAGQTLMAKKIDASPNKVILSGSIEGNTSLELNAPMASVMLVWTSQWEVAGSSGDVSGGTPAPFAPVTGATSVGNGQVAVYFTQTGPPTTNYTVTSSPGGLTATGATSPVTVSGLTNGTSYSFTVTANNPTGSTVSTSTPSVTPFNFTPSSISGLSAWYDAAQLTGVADGGAIASLPDLSGGGNAATQSTPSKRPTFWCKTGAVTLPNNQPVMQFSGAQALATILTAPNIAQPNTIFVVGSQTATGAVAFFFDGGNSRETIHFDSDHFLDFYAGTIVHSTTPEPMAFSQMCVQHNGASSFLRKGGTQIASGNPGSNALTGITLGAAAGATANFLTGLIGEVLVYHGALTLAQIQSVEAYLLDKWGV